MYTLLLQGSSSSRISPSELHHKFVVPWKGKLMHCYSLCRLGSENASAWNENWWVIGGFRIVHQRLGNMSVFYKLSMGGLVLDFSGPCVSIFCKDS